jgi:ribosome-associated heat shock protein Hsp15
MDDDKNRAADIKVDKWLWAARFFKTRSLAAEAVSGGKIEINGERAKPSRVVRIGDKVGIRRGPYDWTIIVKDASRLRGSAPQAQQLYEETEESRRKREAAIAQLRLERPPELAVPGRPSKKNRRAMQRFTKRGWS